MKPSSMTWMMKRGIAAVAMSAYIALFLPSGFQWWLRITLIVLLLLPVIADAYRTFRFYQQNIKGKANYN